MAKRDCYRWLVFALACLAAQATITGVELPTPTDLRVH